MRDVFTEAETGTIIAALRYYQQQGLADNPDMRPEAIHEIATVGDEETSLDSKAIDALCIKVNYLPEVAQQMTVYTLQAEDQHGSSLQIFTQPEGQTKEITKEIDKRWKEWGKGDRPDDDGEAYSFMLDQCGFCDYMEWDEHELIVKTGQSDA